MEAGVHAGTAVGIIWAGDGAPHRRVGGAAGAETADSHTSAEACASEDTSVAAEEYATGVEASTTAEDSAVAETHAEEATGRSARSSGRGGPPTTWM